MSRNPVSTPTAGNNDAKEDDLYDITIAAAAAEAEIVNVRVNEARGQSNTARWQQRTESEADITATRERQEHTQPQTAAEAGYAKSRNGQGIPEDGPGGEDKGADLYDITAAAAAAEAEIERMSRGQH